MASTSHGLLSPTGSTASLTGSGIQYGKNLPLSRIHPLKPGSAKEIALINYVDIKILRTSRRYAKKFSNTRNDADDTKGYETFDEVVFDLDAVFNVVWISGTRTLQTPYLLSLAGLFCSYMPAFPFSPSIFKLVKKFDEAFTSLLRPTWSQREGTTSYEMSTTDKVRIKSLTEETRVVAVEVASEGENSIDLTGSDSDDKDDASTDQETDDCDEARSMDLSRIYKQTIEILGDSLL